ncbi:MAG: hypothetical protein SOY76_05130 [Veillonella caviae]|nr:hypothetical protein [Veillonella caviae]
MDLGLYAILFIIASFILNSKANKRRNEENDNTYDEQETYQSDESNTDRRSNRSWKDRLEAELGVKKKGPARSWEEMEREYGIRIESKEERQPEYQNQSTWQDPFNQTQEPPSMEPPVAAEGYEKSPAQLYVERQAKVVKQKGNKGINDSLPASDYAQRRTHSRHMHIPGAHGRGKLPPGGLKAGITWSLILEKPKALQRQR